MHLDPEILALLALGEQVDDGSVELHLADCPDCRAELVELRRAAALGRSTLDAGELLTPDVRVWSRITEELGLQDASVLDTPDVAPAPVQTLRPRVHGSRVRRRRWVPLAMAASVVAVLGIGGVIGWQVLQSTSASSGDIFASATLKAFPSWIGSSGQAQVEKRPDGTRVVRVSLNSPEHSEGFDEVWLMSSDAKKLVAIGVLEDGSGTFTIPADIDLDRYDQVDISSEPLDGDPAHSSNSIVRGELFGTRGDA